MAVFIQKGDAPLSARQAIKRGIAHVEAEMARAGARKGDDELLRVLPHAELPPRLTGVVHSLGHVSYAAYALGWEADNAVNKAHNIFNIQLSAYRAAQARLSRYRLADGQPEITEEQQVLDEEGRPLSDEATGEPAMEPVVVQAAIDPLPAEIEQPVFDAETGAQIGTEMMPNPAVDQDDAERAEAQAVIEATPTELVAFAATEEAAS